MSYLTDRLLQSRFELTDEEGRKDTYLGGQGLLLIPPTIEIGNVKDEFGTPELSLKYKVPKRLLNAGQVRVGKKA